MQRRRPAETTSAPARSLTVAHIMSPLSRRRPRAPRRRRRRRGAPRPRFQPSCRSRRRPATTHVPDGRHVPADTTPRLKSRCPTSLAIEGRARAQRAFKCPGRGDGAAIPPCDMTAGDTQEPPCRRATRSSAKSSRFATLQRSASDGTTRLPNLATMPTPANTAARSAGSSWSCRVASPCCLRGRRPPRSREDP